MNKKSENVKEWINKHKLELIIGAGGIGIAVFFGLRHKRPGRKIDVNVINPPNVDPFVNLVPATWSAGKLHSLQWSKEDSLICIEDLTADKLGVLGDDLLACAMKKDEPVDAILHIFYKEASAE